MTVLQYGIVGGGMMGMTLAWRLARAGKRVTLLEAAEQCGGLAAPWQLGSIVWDRHYHVTLYSDLALRELLDELELSGEMRWVTTQTGFYANGKLYPFSSVVDYLNFPPLSLAEKARLGYTILTASRITDWRPLERVTAVEWLTRLSGASTVEKIWLPLLRAKLGPYATRASAAFIWAIIARMYAARRTGMKRELFGYVRGGYGRTLRRFEEKLREAGVDIRTSERTQSVEPVDGGIEITTASGRLRFDRAVVTLAAPLVPRICPSLSPEERERCAGVEYQGIVCASLLLDEPLTPYYITNIADPTIPFTAVIEMTALVCRDDFDNASLVYLPKYVAPTDPALQAGDEELETLFLAALARMHPTFDRHVVRALRISRVPYVFPVPTLGYSDRLPPVLTQTPGLYLANSAHIVNGTLNVNETVKLANQLAETLITESAREPLPVAV